MHTQYIFWEIIGGLIEILQISYVTTSQLVVARTILCRGLNCTWKMCVSQPLSYLTKKILQSLSSFYTTFKIRNMLIIKKMRLSLYKTSKLK